MDDPADTQLPTRRKFLELLALGALVPLIGCRTWPNASLDSGRDLRVDRIDLSFARAVLAGVGANKLAGHPAAAALARHQSMSGNPDADPQVIVEEILAGSPDKVRTTAVLEIWLSRRAEMAGAMDAAAAYLPPGSPSAERLFAVIDYDIGVAAPPDVALNAAHERFLNNPGEGVFYACHEAHHVGFLHHRPLPDPTALGGPGVLGKMVDFITQMEGMAVHAAWPLRKQAGALEADPDYEVYLSDDKALEAAKAWRTMRALCGTTEFDDSEVINKVLNAMTSGHRLAYRYGAVVCQAMEKAYGRENLASSVLDPGTFKL